MAAKLKSNALDTGLIVDLSPHINNLLAYDDIASRLKPLEEAKLVSYVKSAFEMSHSRISRRYSHWQEADRAHDVYVDPDATNFREKAVISDTRAIADTVHTYLMAALAGRNPMFMLEGSDRKSRKGAAILERVLHQQMRRTAGEYRISQMLTDSVKYGFAPTKILWSPKENQNNIVNFNPRRCFPDPRVTWSDLKEGQFVGFSDTVPFNSLLSSGLYPSLKDRPDLRSSHGVSRSGWACHKWAQEEGRGLSIDPTESNDRAGAGGFSLGAARTVDELWVRFAGYEIGVPSLTEIWMIITVLDEKHIIRCGLNSYGQQFPMVAGALHNDAHKTYGQSLYDLLLPMHDLSTWLLRSRIDNVQGALNNLIFADPTKVSIPDLIDRNPFNIVRTMPNASPKDSVFIQGIPDVTRGHWNDIQAISELKQRVSAASDAQQGMPTGDVRTATEIQRMTQLGSQRLGVLSRILSATTIRPAVRMMVSNLQDAIYSEGSVRIDEDKMPSMLQNHVEDGYLDYSTAKDLQGDIDYLVVDGTLPLEPTRNAETWMNMMQVMGNTGLNMEYNMGKIAEEAIRAMGISDLDQFRISEEQRAQGMSPSQQMAMMEKQRGNTQGAGQQREVMGQEQLQDQVQRGNLVPKGEMK